MTEFKCQNCKWWQPETNPDTSAVGNGYCTSGHLRINQCGGSDDLFADDCLGEIVLYTGPDFCCIHFETADGQKLMEHLRNEEEKE